MNQAALALHLPLLSTQIVTDLYFFKEPGSYTLPSFVILLIYKSLHYEQVVLPSNNKNSEFIVSQLHNIIKLKITVYPRAIYLLRKSLLVSSQIRTLTRKLRGWTRRRIVVQ